MQPYDSYICKESGEGLSFQEALYRIFSTRKVSLAEAAAPEAEPEPVESKSAPAHRNGVCG